MKKFAADNLLFLRKTYPKIYELVRNRTAKYDRIRFTTARNGQPVVAICDGGRETWLYSRYNPELETLRWAESLLEDAEKSDNLLLFGFGLGYHAEAVLQMYPDKKLFIYEPDLDLFLAAIEQVDLRPVLDHRQVAMFAVGKESGVHEQMLVDILSHAKGSFSFLAPPVYRKWHAELLQIFTERARNTAVSYIANDNTLLAFRKEWFENVFVNLGRNLRTRSFRGLQDSCAGVPAVIAGSGPSLGMEMDHLRTVRDRILLIAAGSSIQPLLHHGVEPDLIVSIDAGNANYRVFRQIDVSHIPFLYVPMLKHTAILDDQSPWLMHAYFGNDTLADELMQLGDEDVVMESTATVTGTAIQAAAWMGCRDIVLIGQDFSYPDNQIYSQGVAHVSDQWYKKKLETEAVLQVPNVSGGENRTSHSLMVLKRSTESIMARIPGVRFYNASPVGAVIEHTSRLSLAQLPERLSASPQPPDWFKSLVEERTKPISQERRAGIHERIDRYAKAYVSWVDEFRRLEDQVQAAAEFFGKQPNERELANWFSEFERIWKKIVDDPIYDKTFSLFMLHEYNHALRNWPEVLEAENGERKLHMLLFCILPLLKAIGELVPIGENGIQYLQQLRER